MHALPDVVYLNQTVKSATKYALMGLHLQLRDSLAMINKSLNISFIFNLIYAFLWWLRCVQYNGQ